MKCESGVSEAIGVVLLLSLVVIGIGLVGVIVFSQSLPQKIPSTSIVPIHKYLDDGTSSKELWLYHDGGEQLQKEEVRFKVNDEDVPDENIELCENSFYESCDPDPFSGSWGLGQYLRITSTDIPMNLSVIFKGGSGELLLLGTSNFISKTSSSSGGGNSSACIGDTTPPIISQVIITPNPAEGCSDASIKWVGSDNCQLKNAKIEYYNGNSWSVLKDPANAFKIHDWSVPGDVGADRKIRVTLRDLSGNTADLSTSFDIQDTTQPSKVTVKSPKEGDVWMIGSQNSISWSSDDCNGVQSANISLSIDGGSSWSSLASGLAGSGTYLWNIPSDINLVSSNVKVRINATDPSGNVGSTQSALFTLGEINAPIVSLSNPNGGEVWEGGTYETISWVATDASGNENIKINLSLTTDGGVNWEHIVDDLSNTGSYLWMVNNIPTNSAKIKIVATDLSKNSAADVSDDLFTILKGTGLSVLLLTPNGGETLTPGTIYNITWNAGPPTITGVNLSYSVDNGNTWLTIVENVPHNDGKYAWTVPSNPTNQGRVKIEAANDKSQTGSDVSNAPFTIINVPSSISVTSPNGGEMWYTGSIHPITWTASDPDGISKFDVYYSLNNGGSWSTIITNLSNTTYQYEWTTPNTPSTSALVKVTVTDSWDVETSDRSNAVFEIRNAPPQVRLDVPNGGQSWSAGSEHQIEWNATDNDGITGIDLAYSLNGGFNWNSIVTGTSNDGIFNWTLPTTTTTTAKVKVTAHDGIGNTASDVSDSVFSIVASVPLIQVTSPNGGEVWDCGTSHAITWTASDSVGISSIDLAYSINDNPITTPIVSGLSNSEPYSYSWTVPNTPSSLVKIVATAHNTIGGTASDSSNAFFRIRDGQSPTITITKPTSSSEFFRCTSGSCPSQIVWIASDNVDVTRIDLYYKNTQYPSWREIITGLSNNGYYYWYVPSVTPSPDTNCYIRAIAWDAAGNSGMDDSEKFTMRNS